jgi:hypothetical protein
MRSDPRARDPVPQVSCAQGIGTSHNEIAQRTVTSSKGLRRDRRHPREVGGSFGVSASA